MISMPIFVLENYVEKAKYMYAVVTNAMVNTHKWKMYCSMGEKLTCILAYWAFRSAFELHIAHMRYCYSSMTLVGVHVISLPYSL